MSVLIPDMEWYREVGRKAGVTGRCPFASAESCPRYFYSLSLLGRAGSTPIEPGKEDQLQRKWERSGLLPVTDEQETTLWGPSDDPRGFWRFCPEVMYDRFGYFASDLHRHSDELDRGLMHQRLGDAQASPGDWRWQWSSLKPMHFTECPLYGPLEARIATDAAPRTDELIRRIKDHPVGSVVVALGVIVLAVAAFTDAVRRVWEWVATWSGF